MSYRYSLSKLPGKTIQVTNFSSNTFRGTSPFINKNSN